jgi:cytochrome c oxidase assembly protein subunit 15
LRIWHPTLALAVGVLLVTLARAAVGWRDTATVRMLAALVVAGYALQLGIGLANIWWLAPVPLQIVHLLVADLIWIGLVLLGLAVLAEPEVREHAV